MGIATVFFDQDLRLGVDGLRILLKQKRIATSAMRSGDFILFINRSKKHAKLFWTTEGKAVLVAVRKDKGRLSLEDIKHIPTLFTGNLMTAKVSDHITKHLKTSVQVLGDESGLRVS
jgi:hypothetical protein